ncbi:MAG: hypothetical protein E6G56_02785 [Actinobacteria bacterium]|nr:MAG: hypothetical protein E6G56_02785 [Actinomycetota bacterium]
MTALPAARCVVAVSAALAVVSLTACGAGKPYANNPRPPAPIVVTANISPTGVSVSPSKFGAGPIELIVANLTGSSQQLTLQGTDTTLHQQTGPINPQDTASLKADVPTGSYAVRVEDRNIKAAHLNVGPSRASAQNQLLQP